MGLIDWRELYAANQAAIERSRAGRGPLAGAASVLPGLIRPRLPKGAARPGRAGPKPRGVDHHPGGSGTWERFAHGGGRSYCVYTPQRAERGAALLVMLHGCTQSAADLARGTRMNEAADRHGFLVAYPEQTGRHNPRGCWNWFLPGHQARGAGEPAALAALTEEATLRAEVDPRRVFLVGMSAGAAMAAVMGATYPDLFAAIALHSGLPYAAATSTVEALRLMSRGGADVARCGRAAFEAMGERARVMPAIVVHGGEDGVVSPANGDAAVEQWLVTNRLAAGGDLDAQPRSASAASDGRGEGGLAHSTRRWTDARGRLVQGYLRVEGLGHAWSGGSAAGSYADGRGPDATRAICDFFAELGRG